MSSKILRMLRYLRFHIGAFLLIISDSLALASALALSLCLYFDHLPLGKILDFHIYSNARSLLIALVFFMMSFHAFRLYRYAWRFASLETAGGVIGANTVGLSVLIASQRLLGDKPYPVSIYIVFWLLSVTFVGGVRILLRLASLGTSHGRGAFQLIRRDTIPKKIVILGNETSSARILSELAQDTGIQYDVLGVLDDTPGTKGKYIRNTRVIGPLRHLQRLLDERAVDEVLIALPDASGAEIRQYVLACRKLKVPVKIIPELNEVLNGRGHAHMEEISVEDLLRRSPVRINMDKIGGCLAGARVLVTGAGGSIGSELCRQILALEPATLVLLGHGENSIYQIHEELRRIFPDMSDRLKMVVASVSDEIRMGQVFHTHRPQVVFHAAAHKHVPIMETNLLEAVQNNVLGTNCVAECCGRYGAEKMVLISSDKAVMPSSVMGATKWLCEEVVRSMVEAYPRTRYIAVRFGNVLGSRGSVVPIFHEAIKNGGPVIVTHPEMTRFFMSIPESVQLVLQAGASGESGELFLLDMGQPVKILDLACDMIRLCGFEPNVDIPITYCGIRPGEKMHEYLTTEDEDLQAATCDGLFVVNRPGYFKGSDVTGILLKMRGIISDGDTLEMRSMLEEFVPGFCTDTIFAAEVTGVES